MSGRGKGLGVSARGQTTTTKRVAVRHYVRVDDHKQVKAKESAFTMACIL
jgi:hypothetical protein